MFSSTGNVSMKNLYSLRSAAIDSLSAHIAIIDNKGIILVVNHAWLKFGRENGAELKAIGKGVNYLDACASAKGDEDAQRFLSGLFSVMRGSATNQT